MTGLGRFGGSESSGPRAPSGGGTEYAKGLRSGREELYESPEGSFTVARVKAGEFTRDTTTASGTQAITGVGFKPYAVIFLMAEDGGKEASIGVDDGTNAFSIFANDNITADTWSASGGESIAGNDSAGNGYTGDIASLDLDGFTINWVKTGTPTGTYSVKYFAFGRG